MIRASPRVLATLVGPQLGLGLVSGIEILPSTFTTPPPEYHADLALELRTRRLARLIVLVEVQLSVDAGKQASWPAYEAVARSRHGAPACVVVLTPDAAVARWASRPVALGPSGSVFRAVVLGPRDLPREVPGDAPVELAVLAALGHGRDRVGGADVVRAALRALGALRLSDPETARLYFDLLSFKMKEQVRLVVEEMMPEGQQYMSDWLREAQAKGIEQGKREGREEGRTEHARRTLRMILSARGLELDQATEALVASCDDVEQLDAWTARAATATTLAQAFAPA